MVPVTGQMLKIFMKCNINTLLGGLKIGELISDNIFPNLQTAALGGSEAEFCMKYNIGVGLFRVGKCHFNINKTVF